MQVQETFAAKRMAASGQLFGVSGGLLGGFLCTTAGTLALDEGVDATGADIVSSITLTAGQYVPIPLAAATYVYATLGGGCVGTFFVA